MKRLPVVTHLQFVILDLIGEARSVLGQEIRVGLREFGEANTSASFYMSMRRLEEAGFVEGTYVLRKVSGRLKRKEVIRERAYHLTPDGKQRHDECLDFYRTTATATCPNSWP